jgi:GDP-6-deoxy-D-talose 4-dehydrogenase
MREVLLTGAQGFTGRVIADFLKSQGMRVVALKSDLTVKDTLRDELAQCKPDWVIHLAALSFVGDTHLEAFYRVNVIGTVNLLEVLDEQGHHPSRILIASSANIYGSPTVSVVNEKVPPSPVNHYACSKLAMEYMVRPWFQRFSIVLVRPFNYTGLGQDTRFLIPKIVDHFVRGAQHIELGNVDISRDFSDVRDVVQAYVKLLHSSFQSDVINICSGRVYSLRQILQMMADIAGYTIDISVNPAFVRTNDIPVLSGDPSYLKEVTGFSPEIIMQDTLKEMYSVLKSHTYA